ncbi:MAG: tetratricopeptide repeat protein, partial [Phycisphaerae bacterium]|nr:tetratricopeptide repeat protein [Phycisphaerae bacterium]
MASKVNVKFVGGLAAVLLILAGVVGFLGYRAIRSSPEELIAKGDKFAAEGNWEQAMRSYGNAVNKEQTSAAYLKKWIDAITKTKPSAYDLYQERYRTYLGALRKLGELGRNDPESHRLLLDMNLRELRSAGTPAGAQGFLTDLDRVLSYFPESDKNRSFVLRYRGVARCMLLTVNALPKELTPQMVRQDLEAAIAYNPKDELAVATLGEWYATQINAARAANDATEAARLSAEARKMLADFVAANPPAVQALLVLTRLEIADAYIEDAGRTPAPQMAASQSAKARRMLDALAGADPTVVDETIVPATVALAMGTQLQNAVDECDKLMQRMIEGRPDDVMARFQAAELMWMSQRFEEANKRYAAIVALPDMPVSWMGIRLFKLRDAAAQRQFDCALGAWDVAKTPEERAAALTQAKERAAALKARLGEADPQVTFANAKLAYTENDLVTSRQLLSRYMQGAPNDTQAMLLLAQVLLRQNQLGAARSQLERIIELRAGNVNVYTALANIEGQMRNYAAAARALESALRLDPTNPALVEQYMAARSLEAGEQAANPIIRALARAQRLMNQSEPDFPGALRELLDVADKEEPQRAQDALALAQGLAQLGERDKSLKVLEKAVAKWPEATSLAELRDAIVNPSAPGERQLDAISKSNLDDFAKAVQRAMVFRRLGKTAEFEAELNKAKAIRPDDPVVLSFEFDSAIAAKQFDRARALADKAAAANADKVGGAIFRAQLDMAEGRTADAARAAQQATDRDPLNATAWRMLGELRLMSGLTAEGVSALERARQIKPDDTATLVSLTRAKMTAGRAREALAVARDGVMLGSDDPALFNLWCQLEFDYGDQIKAVERRARMFQINPNDRANALDFCRMLVRRRDYKLAEGVIKHLEETGPPELVLTVMKSVVTAVGGDADGAIRAAERAIADIPADKRQGTEHVAFARALAEAGQMDLAVRLLEGARAAQDPKLLPLDRELGDMYFNTGQYEKALAIYQRVRDAAAVDTDSMILKRLVECNLRLSRTADAKALLDSAGDAEAKDKQLLLLRAQLAMATRDEAAARSALDRALTLDPNLAVAYYLRGQLNVDDPARARDAQADLEQSLRLEPTQLYARRALMRYWVRQGQFDRGMAVMNEGLALNPDDGSLRLEIAQLFVMNNASEEALKLFNEGARRQPKEAAWPSLCGEIYAGRRDFVRAVESFSKAYTLDPTLPITQALVESLLSIDPPDTDRARDILDDPKHKIETQWTLLMLRARVGIAQGKASEAEADAAAAFRLIKADDIVEASNYVRAGLRAFISPRAGAPDRTADALAMIGRAVPATAMTDAMSFAVARSQLGLAEQRERGMATLRRLCDSTDKVVAAESLKTVAGMLYGDGKYAESA